MSESEIDSKVSGGKGGLDCGQCSKLLVDLDCSASFSYCSRTLPKSMHGGVRRRAVWTGACKEFGTAQSVRILQRTSKILRCARREVRMGRFSDRLTTLTLAQMRERSVNLAAGNPRRREAKIPGPERRETARIDDQKEDALFATKTSSSSYVNLNFLLERLRPGTNG